jgi:hypothetical protein
MPGKTFLKFTQDTRDQILTGGSGGTDAHPAVTPFPQLTEARSGDLQFTKSFAGVLEKLFSSLSEHDFFAQSVQKATAHIILQ